MSCSLGTANSQNLVLQARLELRNRQNTKQSMQCNLKLDHLCTPQWSESGLVDVTLFVLKAGLVMPFGMNGFDPRQHLTLIAAQNHIANASVCMLHQA